MEASTVTLTDLTEGMYLSALTGLTDPDGKGGKGVRVAVLDRWTLTLAGLRGEPWPRPPELPGTVHLCRDAPLPPELLADITDPIELALCAGISRQAAHARLKARGASIAPATDA